MLNDIDTKIADIRERLSGWKSKGKTCIDFGAPDIDVLLDAFDRAAAERDQARELHAKVCDTYADACVRLTRISNIVAGFRSAHARDAVEIGPDREAARAWNYIGTIPSTAADEALDTRYRRDMHDAGRGHLLR